MERGNKKELVHNEKEEKKNECIIEERNAREQKKRMITATETRIKYTRKEKRK